MWWVRTHWKVVVLGVAAAGAAKVTAPEAVTAAVPAASQGGRQAGNTGGHEPSSDEVDEDDG